MRALYRLLGLAGDAKAISRGPGPYVRRVARKRANRAFNQGLRKVLRP